MTGGEQVPPTLTAHRVGPRWRLRMPLLVVGLAGVVTTVVLVAAAVNRDWPPPVMLLVGLGAGLQLLLAAQEVDTVTISSDGVSWRGLGWARSRPWADFTEIGMHRPDAESPDGSVVARLAPGARPPSMITFPQLRRIRRPPGSLALLVPLTQPVHGATWDVPDQKIVDAVRAHADDRWVEDLRPVL